MTKNIAKIVLAAMCSLGGFAAVGSTAGAASVVASVKHPTYPLKHAKRCRVNYVKRTERRIETRRVKVDGKWKTVDVRKRVKVDGKWRVEFVRVRYIACVYVAPKLTLTAPTTTTVPAAPSSSSAVAPTTTTVTSPITTTTVPVVTTVRAQIDPTWVLATTVPQSPPVPVTFTYDATTSGALPNGTLTLSIYVANSVAQAGGCQANVGASVTSATCTVNIPAWGSYTLITSYSGGTNVSATGQTETVDIEPPVLPPETIVEQWGVTSPTNGATITANVVGTTATVSLADPNFEGATSVTITDQRGDTCTATVASTTAACMMTVTGTPNAFTVAYPGGLNQVTMQTVSPWGIAQSQTVTYQWPSEVVSITNPTVTSQSATVLWNGGHLLSTTGSSFGTWSGNPSDPITITQGQGVSIDAYASGSLSTDQYPLGAISYTVGQMSGVTMTDEQPASSSVNCSGSYNYSNEAVGVCNILFSSTGTYTITIGYVSGDPNYASVTDALSETVNVT